MKKKFYSLVLLIVSLLTLCGCTKVVSSSSENVNATIVSTHHKGMWLQPVLAGKVTTFINHPEKNEVTVQYNDIVMTFNDKEFYNKCVGHDGEKVECILVTVKYDNDTEKSHLEIKNNG